MKTHHLRAGIIVLILLAAGIGFFAYQSSTSSAALSQKVIQLFKLQGEDITISSITKENGVYHIVARSPAGLKEVWASGDLLFPSSLEIDKSISLLSARNDWYSCLASKNVKLYGAADTNITVLQFQTIGATPLLLAPIYTDCSGTNAHICTDAGVDKVPTWIIDGKNFTGAQTISALAQASGCPYAS